MIHHHYETLSFSFRNSASPRTENKTRFFRGLIVTRGLKLLFYAILTKLSGFWGNVNHLVLPKAL